MPRTFHARIVSVLSLALAPACGSEDAASTPARPDPQPDAATQLNPEAGAEAASEAKDVFLFETGEFTVPAGEERYLCYTQTLDEVLDVQQIDYTYNPVVHHMAMVTTLVPEPEEPFECDVFFKSTWIPVFANGLGDGSLRVPDGAAFHLEAGSQLMVQLHLLNTSTDEVSTKVALELTRAAGTTNSQAGIYGFGTTLIELPPGQQTTLTNDCAVDSEVNIFGVFPHMHTLGKTIRFLTGPSESELAVVFEQKDWNFDAQAITPLDLRLQPGDLTRVECTYDNVRNETVTFGESTFDEMCFFTAFRTEYEGLDGCLELGGYAGQTPAASASGG